MTDFLAIFAAVMSLFNYAILIRIFHKMSDIEKENKNEH